MVAACLDLLDLPPRWRRRRDCGDVLHRLLQFWNSSLFRWCGVMIGIHVVEIIIVGPRSECCHVECYGCVASDPA